MPEVRLLRPEDVESLYSLLTTEIWGENGLFPFSEEKVRRMLNIASKITPWKQGDPMVIVGVIGEPGKVEGSVGLVVAQFWYTEAWHMEDCWTCVGKDYRSSEHAAALLAFSKQMQRQMELPLLMGILSDIRTEAKLRYFRRALGEPVGAVFAWPPLVDVKTHVRADVQLKDATGDGQGQ